MAMASVRYIENDVDVTIELCTTAAGLRQVMDPALMFAC